MPKKEIEKKVLDPKDCYVMVDADTPLFAAATMCENRYIVVKHKETNTEQRFDNLTEFKGVGNDSKEYGRAGSWLYNLNKDQENKGCNKFHVNDFTIHQRSEIKEDIVAAKKAINNLVDKLLLLPWCKRTKLRLVIGGYKTDADFKPNFRYDIAKSFAYKSQRGPKPIIFLELRDWMIQKYGDMIVVAQGAEADDYLSIFNTWCNEQNKSCVLVYIDKDINGCPNQYWYSTNKLKDIPIKTLKEILDTDPNNKILHPVYINKEEADKAFYAQVITGDWSTDRIPGLIGCGKVFAQKRISLCKTEKEMMIEVINAYKEYANKDVKGINTDMFVVNEYQEYSNWLSVLEEQFRLVNLMKKRDVIPDIHKDFERLDIDINEMA